MCSRAHWKKRKRKHELTLDLLAVNLTLYRVTLYTHYHCNSEMWHLYVILNKAPAQKKVKMLKAMYCKVLLVSDNDAPRCAMLFVSALNTVMLTPYATMLCTQTHTHLTNTCLPHSWHKHDKATFTMLVSSLYVPVSLSHAQQPHTHTLNYLANRALHTCTYQTSLVSATKLELYAIGLRSCDVYRCMIGIIDYYWFWHTQCSDISPNQNLKNPLIFKRTETCVYISAIVDVNLKRLKTTIFYAMSFKNT